jgi:hypothetical protein
MANGQTSRDGQRHRVPGQVGAPNLRSLMGDDQPKAAPRYANLREALDAALAKVAPTATHTPEYDNEPDNDVADGSRLDRLRVALGSDVVEYFMESVAGKKLIEKWVRAKGDARDEARHKLSRYVAVDLDKTDILARIDNEIHAIDEDDDE